MHPQHLLKSDVDYWANMMNSDTKFSRWFVRTDKHSDTNIFWPYPILATDANAESPGAKNTQQMGGWRTIQEPESYFDNVA